jgi:hypothetical protein
MSGQSRSKAVTEQNLVHLESRANRREGKRRHSFLKKCLGLSEPVITVCSRGRKEKSWSCPWDRRACFNAKVNDRPFLVSTKSSLAVLYFFPRFPTQLEMLRIFRLVLLYLGLSTFFHILKGGIPITLSWFFKWLIKITYLIILLNFPRRKLNKRVPLKFHSKSSPWDIGWAYNWLINNITKRFHFDMWHM